jgi:negative modulator of initiation of replication
LNKEAAMKPVLVEDDVYEHISRITMERGVSPSVTLREALGIGLGIGSSGQRASKADPQGAGHELVSVLDEPLFRTGATAVSRMLRIFRAAHDMRKGEFAKVLEIHGRNRAYFARTEEEILKSGKSTQPRQIPGTGYWVMTNSPTPQKQEMVREVLNRLGFSKAASDAAAATVV